MITVSYLHVIQDPLLLIGLSVNSEFLSDIFHDWTQPSQREYVVPMTIPRSSALLYCANRNRIRSSI